MEEQLFVLMTSRLIRYLALYGINRNQMRHRELNVLRLYQKSLQDLRVDREFSLSQYGNYIGNRERRYGALRWVNVVRDGV